MKDLVLCVFVFLVPTALYAVNNNLDMLITEYMDVVTIQVLFQNKILVTSLLWRIVFQQALEVKQWFALVLLTIGSVVASIDTRKGNDITTILSSLKLTPTGIFLILIYCFFSAGASIYCEFLYKRTGKQSIYFQNLGMYTGGLIVNYTGYLSSQWAKKGDIMEMSFVIGFSGWNIVTFMDCINKACLGLLLGFVLKYLGNIHKLFMFGASMFFMAALSFVWGNFFATEGSATMGWQPTFESITGMLTILCSLFLYNSTQLQAMFGSATKTVS